MATQFYRGEGSERYLARGVGQRPPDIFWDDTQEWAPYPDLNTLTEAYPITREQALQWPGMTEQLLDAPTGAPSPPP